MSNKPCFLPPSKEIYLSLLIYLLSLSNLQLGNNEINHLPCEMTNLFSLTNLKLVGNQLEVLSFFLFDLRNLQCLHIPRNSLQSMF